MSQKIPYEPRICSCCKQSETYLLTVDHGTADIVKAIASAIRRKGANEIHPRREMEMQSSELDHATMIREGYLTSNSVGNLSRARFHGLIARVAGKSGHYCLTTKGANFLRGEPVPKYAIISKVTGHQEGYWLEQSERVTVVQVTREGDYWQELDYTVRDGKIAFDEPKNLRMNF